MALQTFELEKGRVFVAGLFWQTLTRPQNLKDEIRKLAADLDFNLYIIREATVPQVGLLSTADGGQAGQMSCAAIVSKTLEIEHGYTSVLCAIQLPDGQCLFVAIRDGTIMPEGDLIDSEQEVEKRFTEYQSIGDWPIRVAPEHWGVDDSTERSFESFLPKNDKGIQYRKWWHVLDVAGDRRKLIKSAVLLTIIGAAIGMGYMLYQKNQQQALQTAMDIQAAEERRQKTASYANIKIEHPWVSVAHPVDVMVACEKSFKNRYIFAAGWVFESFMCNNQQAAYTWNRDKTTFASLKALLPEAVGNDLGSKAAMAIPFALSMPNEELLPNTGEGKAAFIELMQRLGGEFALLETPVTIPLPPDADAGAIPPSPDYRAYHWTVSASPLRPISVATYLAIPSLRITKVSATFNGGAINWDYEGDIYEKN